MPDQPVFQCAVNNTEMHALNFDSQFEVFSYFVLRKCSVNRPPIGKPIGEDKWTRMSKRNSGVLVLKYFENCIVNMLELYMP